MCAYIFRNYVKSVVVALPEIEICVQMTYYEVYKNNRKKL
jgi:hypothetical protein